MSYTMEDFERDYARDHIHLLSKKEVLGQYSPEEVLEQYSPEEIEKYLTKVKKQMSKIVKNHL